MLAILGAVMLLDRQTAGAISGTVLYLFPLPMVFYASKYGWKDSLTVLAALFALLFMLGTPQSVCMCRPACGPPGSVRRDAPGRQNCP